MRRIVLTTLLADFTACFAMGLVMLFASPGSSLLIMILVFGNVLIPTLAAVLLYQPVKKKTVFITGRKRLVIRILVLAVILWLGLILWTIVDVIPSGITWETLQEDFNREFRGFIPVAFCLAIAIPAIDQLLERNAGRNGKTAG